MSAHSVSSALVLGNAAAAANAAVSQDDVSFWISMVMAAATLVREVLAWNRDRRK